MPSTIVRPLLGLSLAVAACGDDQDSPPQSTESSSTGTSGPTASSSSMPPDGTAGSESSSDGSSSVGSSGSDASSDDGSSSGSSSSGGSACEADVIELPGEAFYPEGVAADGDTLYVGSIATGEIVRASMCDGSVEAFAPAGQLTSAVGLRVDGSRGVLWACNNDPSFATLPSIVALDLDDGSVVATHAFEDPAFCNDLALDDAGNLYATDSAGARIVRVAASDALEDTAVELWSADAEYAVPKGEFGLNGIVWDDAGLIRVVNFFDGRLYEVAVEPDGSAGAVTIVGPPDTLAGPDGMLAHGDRLLVVEGGAQRLSLIDPISLDVDVVADGFDFPTTVAVDPAGEFAWVAEGQFDHLFGFDPDPPELPFEVVRVAMP